MVRINENFDNVFTEEDLNWLNQYVYNVDKEKHAKENLKRPIKDEKLTMENGTEVMVVKVKDDEHTGYQGIAVAPIINDQPDYNQIAVVSAGTDPSQLSTDVWSAIFQGKAPFQGEGQLGVADDFVDEINGTTGWTVTQLSGYSQSAYMLQVGAKHKIPTTVFNGWFLYANLSEDEKKFMKANPELFINYRNTKDMTTFLNDGNWKAWAGEDFGTIIWIEGSSHNIYDWEFDENGYLIVQGDLAEQGLVRRKQIEKQASMLLRGLSTLAKKLKASGGGLSSAEKIFLDSSEALIILSNAATLMQTGLDGAIKIYKEAIEETEVLWQDTLQRAQGIGTELTYVEVLEALEHGGASKDVIVGEPTEYYTDKITKAKELYTGFDSLLEEIKGSIAQLVATDQDLASQI